MSRTGRLVVAGVVVLVLALGGGFLLFLNRTSDSPPPAALDPRRRPPPGGHGPGGRAAAHGTWQVSDDGKSFVGYRVEAARLLSSPNEAVGRSTAVTGTMEVAGHRRVGADRGRPDPADQRRAPPRQRHPPARAGVGAVPDGHPELAEPLSSPPPGRGRAGPRPGHGPARRPRRHPRGRPRRSGTLERVDHPGRGQLPVKMSDFQIEPPLRPGRLDRGQP